MLLRWARPAVQLSSLQRMVLTSASLAGNMHVVSVAQVQCRQATTEAVMEHTNLTHNEASEAIKRFKLLQLADENKIRESAHTLQVIGIPCEDYSKYPDILTLMSVTIDNYTRILQESGFTQVLARDLAFYKPIMSKRISLLKAHGCIPDEVNVAKHIIGCIPDLPECVAQQILAKLDCNIDKQNIRKVYEGILHHYLCWRLEASEDTIKRVIHTYFRIKNKSLVLIAQAIDLLINEFGFSKDRILKHGYLIHSYPIQIIDSLECVQTLGGVPLREVVHKCPRILHRNSNTLLSMQQLFNDFGISNEAVRRCFTIFTLATHTVRQRLIDATNDPLLSGLANHPRILLLVIHKRLAARRLQLLQQMQLQCFSLNLISASSTKKFGKYTSSRMDGLRGFDVLFYICQALKCDSARLRTELKKHPHWHHVPISTVSSNMLLLAKRCFPPHLIRQNVHLLLYPTECIQQTLDSINYILPENAVDWSSQLTCDYTKRNSKLDEPSVSSAEMLNKDYFMEKDNTKLFQEIPVEDSSVTEWHLVLQTCLYLLEKPHHFTGDALWSGREERELAAAASG